MFNRTISHSIKEKNNDKFITKSCLSSLPFFFFSQMLVLHLITANHLFSDSNLQYQNHFYSPPTGNSSMNQLSWLVHCLTYSNPLKSLCHLSNENDGMKLHYTVHSITKSQSLLTYTLVNWNAPKRWNREIHLDNPNQCSSRRKKKKKKKQTITGQGKRH